MATEDEAPRYAKIKKLKTFANSLDQRDLYLPKSNAKSRKMFL
jgi:hypothetical protein